MSLRCCHGFASGRVQGVAFRHFTRTQAENAGLTGWVRNTADGRVEFLLCGNPAAVESVLAALRQGPARARVESLEHADRAPGDWTDFRILA